MISVVMPAYNASKFIHEAIKSVLNQTYTDFECIIINDASTDNTLEIINHYAKIDHRIKVLHSEQNMGCTRAIMWGIEEAKYQWIARMDADDICLPKRFQKQIEAANKNPKVIVWGTYVNHINSQGQILGTGLSTGAKTEKEFYERMNNGKLISLYHPTWLINKNFLLKAGGYDSTIEAAQDFELLSRLSYYGPLLVIPEPLLLYRVHSQSVSMQKFFLQQVITKFVYARHAARQSGKLEPNLKDFMDSENQQNLILSLQNKILTLSKFWYRKAGLFIADKKYVQGIYFLLLSIIARPSYAVPRIWEQKMSSRV